MSTTINCKMTTLTPFHTGADTKEGNIMKLRKESKMPEKREMLTTKFATEADLDKAVVLVLYVYYKSMDKDIKNAPNAYGGYGILFSFVRKAVSCSGSWSEFQSKLLELINAENIQRWYRDDYKKCIKDLDFDIFCNVFSRKQKYFRAELQYNVQVENEAYNNLSDDEKEMHESNLDFCSYELSETGFSLGVKSIEVPVITGNSIVGKIRRIAFDAFVDLLGVPRESFKNQLILELLIQGGRNLHKTKKGLMNEIEGSISDFYYTSDGVINIKNRVELFKNVPFAALFGFSFGNQTQESLISTTYGTLRCIENGTGEFTADDHLDIMFYTHKDEISSFSHDFEIAPEGTAQMKYDVEVVKSNSVFDTWFKLMLPNAKNELEQIIESCFYWLLEIFQENAMLGARNNRGEGHLSVEYDIDISEKSALFVNYVKENSESIKKYLQIQ